MRASVTMASGGGGGDVKRGRDLDLYWSSEREDKRVVDEGVVDVLIVERRLTQAVERRRGPRERFREDHGMRCRIGSVERRRWEGRKIGCGAGVCSV